VVRTPIGRTRAFGTGLLGAVLTVILAGAAVAAGSTTVVVRPSALNGWTLGGSAGIITVQPAGGMGSGAVRVESQVATTGRGFVRTDVAPVSGSRLADLTRVDYQVAVAAYPPASQFLTGYVNLSLALDGNAANTGNAGPGQPNLVTVTYEPCYALPANYSGTIQPLNSWHTWSATPASPAWWPDDQIGAHAPASIYSTLDAVVLGAYPDAVITAMKVQVGQLGAGTPWQGWSGWLDGVRFVAGGASPVDELVDFEPNLPAPPGAPTTVKAAATASTASLTWAPPTTGGIPILRYIVVVNGVSHTLPASARSFTVNGLSVGTIVHFTVAAVNVAGTGPAAAASVEVIAAQPEHPVAPTLPDTGPDQLATSLLAAAVLLGLGVPLTLANARRSRSRRP
jgi:hypothetical protein